MSGEKRTADQEVICEDVDCGNPPMMGDIDRSSDPGNPVVRIECGCNELWFTALEARAVAAYLQRILPQLERGGEDG